MHFYHLKDFFQFLSKIAFLELFHIKGEKKESATQLFSFLNSSQKECGSVLVSEHFFLLKYNYLMLQRLRERKKCDEFLML